MRQIATLLLLFGVALTAGAAEIWRWKDANGVVHYSDQPRPGAERVQVTAPPPSGGDVRPPPSVTTPSASMPEPRPAAFAYTTCAVVSPASEETFRGVQAVSVTLAVEPGLQPGHRIQVFVNGAARTDWPANSTSYTFAEVFRGSHTLTVRIVDQGGRALCNGPPSTFHVQQVGLLSPGRPVTPAGN